MVDIVIERHGGLRAIGGRGGGGRQRGGWREKFDQRDGEKKRPILFLGSTNNLLIKDAKSRWSFTIAC